MHPQIKFYFNFQEDLDHTLYRLTHTDPAGFDNRIKETGLDPQVVSQVLKSQDDTQKNSILAQYFKQIYQQNSTQITAAIIHYQQIWDKISDTFFSLVTSKMDSLPWKFPEYLFRVSAFFSHAAWGQSNRLAVWFKHEPQKSYFLNGYELILTHYFEITDQLYPEKRPISNWHIWALAEIAAYFIIYKDNDLIKNLWPGLTEPQSFGYPTLLKPIKDLYPVLQNSKNYSDFVRQGIQYIKQYPVAALTQPSN